MQSSESAHTPTRVLHVVESWGAGVAGAVLEMVQNAREAEHHLMFGERVETGALGASWRSLFVSATPLPDGHLASVRSVRSRVKALAPAVVHAHSSFAGVYARVAARTRADRRIVYSPHCYAFERRDLGRAARGLARTAEWFLSFNTDTVASCSRGEAALSRWRPASPRVVFIPNVASISGRPSSARARTGHGALRVGAAGRLTTQKGYDFFVESVVALRAAGQTVDAVWIGGGDSPAEELLRSNGIRVTGWVDRAATIAELVDLDVYLHTAAWEGFPLAVLEATELGLPVIVRDIAAFDEVDLPLRVTTPRDVAALWPPLHDPAEREKLAERGRWALRGNTRANQRSALRELYFGRVADRAS